MPKMNLTYLPNVLSVGNNFQKFTAKFGHEITIRRVLIA